MTIGPQRALIWQRFDALELIIEPVFDWEPGTPGAWVIPLPALPQEIKAGDPVFLKDLDRATAPRFEEACIDTSCCCYPEPCDLAAPETKLLREELGVIVWASGSVGALDYVVLSSAEGYRLAQWLQDNDFEIPNELLSVITDLETAGVYWFVAKVSHEPDRSLMPVSFTFAPVVKPFYPVGLTLNALAQDQHLEVRLFALTETGEPLLPTSHPWTTAREATGYWPGHCFPVEPYYQSWGLTPDLYTKKIAWYLSKTGGFVLEAFGYIRDTPASVTSFKSETMKALLRTEAKVSRLWGYLFPKSETINEVSLQNAEPGTLPEYSFEQFPVWCRLKGFCRDCPPCAPPKEFDWGTALSEDLPTFETYGESLPDEQVNIEGEEIGIAESPEQRGAGSGCNAGHHAWLSSLLLAILFLAFRFHRSR